MNSSSGTGPGGGALNNPSSGKIDQQRKILEELERQKKLLNKGNAAAASTPASAASASATSSATAASTASSPVSLPPGAALQQDPSSPNSPLLSANQRSALEAASKTSFGYFIPQDSSFGNTILPVIPRIGAPAGGK